MLLIFLGWLNIFFPHAIYIGVIDLSHRAGEHEATLVVKVFTNDLEDCLVDAYGQRYGLSKENITAHHQAWQSLQNYVAKQVIIKINDTSNIPILTKTEVLQDSYWMYFKLASPTHWTQVEVTAELLTELFPDQVNVVHLNEGSHKQYFRLTKRSKSVTARFSH